MYIYLCNIKKNKEKISHIKKDFSKDTLSHNLLLEAFRHYNEKMAFGVPYEEIRKMTVRTDKGGKPYFFLHDKEMIAAFPHIHFSVSHSGDWWSCLFSDSNVGLDIEERRSIKNYEAIAKRFFTYGEHQYVLDYGQEGFFQIWVRKEAYLKYTGKGISGGLSTFSVVQEGQLSSQVLMRKDDTEDVPVVVFGLELSPDLVGAYCTKKGKEVQDIIYI